MMPSPWEQPKRLVVGTLDKSSHLPVVLYSLTILEFAANPPVARTTPLAAVQVYVLPFTSSASTATTRPESSLTSLVAVVEVSISMLSSAAMFST